MDFSMVQNVSAAALRSKGRNYTTSGLASAESVKAPATSSVPSGKTGISFSAASRMTEIQDETRASVQRARVEIQTRQGLATYANLVRSARENRFRTRYDLLI